MDGFVEMVDIPPDFSELEGGRYRRRMGATGNLLVPPSSDPSDKMWSIYLSESEKHDKIISDGWKDDANGVLVFTGLFSAIVAAFIIESYRKLSPDSGDQTVFFLQQISQQLSGLANGTYVRPQDYPTFSPSTSIVCVNAMWILSLIVSLTCALLALLMQQWARQYVQLPLLGTTPRERARVQYFLHLGLKPIPMSNVVELISTLLHLAMFMFFTGLVVFLFTVTRKIATITSVSVGISIIAYIVPTILPSVYLDYPYRTPLSNLSWYVWHTVVYYSMALFLWVEARVHPRRVPTWREKFEFYARNHDQQRKDGLRKSVANRAQDSPEDRDLLALEWFLLVLDLSEDIVFQKFVSTLPGDTVTRLLQRPDSQFSSSFSRRLRDLLWTCLPGTASLTPDAQYRLLTCLDAIYRGLKAFNVAPLDQSGKSVLDSIRLNFAELGMMRVLWSDQGTAIRVSARCICALLARRILRDIGGPGPRRTPGDGELSWLTAVFDKPSSNVIFRSLGNLAEVDSMNLESFVDGVDGARSVRGVTNKEIISILDTLAILMEVDIGSRVNGLEDQVRALIQKAETVDVVHFVEPLLERLRQVSP
ncbi:hypothetical protein EDB92DRAFT_1620088 [Lactarius akahatsu]|uniref:DUF6535 domain-containing protein n=1 Tax=Lactarius akahatsu TaxID=416441 RepID=A0AAD4L7B7_9AGAM|nr:hypothetical protein EDB92DRAFT_1620088 [Lactarius akahatsu]